MVFVVIWISGSGILMGRRWDRNMVIMMVMIKISMIVISDIYFFF